MSKTMLTPTPAPYGAIRGRGQYDAPELWWCEHGLREIVRSYGVT